MSTASHIACIVVPIYQNTLTRAEVVSLEQCLRVLNYPIVVAKPESLDLSPLLAKYSRLVPQAFPDEYFRGVDGYNRLMLSDAFYARFSDYEFILIHQLDAFVFKDELIKWCGRNYDYIGAPWIPTPDPPSTLELIDSHLKRHLYQMLNRQNRDGSGAHHRQYAYVGGNGGLSLRRVAVMRNTLAELASRLDVYRARNHHSHNEDIFFCIEANRFRKRIRLAPLREALQFSWEAHPHTAMRMNHEQLPFGCHGWNRLYRDEWHIIFAQQGFDLDSILSKPL